jgi:xanthosine utilization system XapX-like protein
VIVVTVPTVIGETSADRCLADYRPMAGPQYRRLGGSVVNASDPSARPSRRSRLAERRWCRPAAELTGLVIGVALYSWLHNLAGTNVAAATTNAQALQSWERSLNLSVELAANHWLAGHPVLMQAAVLYYRLYYLPLVGVLLWVLFSRAELYPTIRRTLMVMAALALLVFWLVPMSPPRFALVGIVDIVAEHDLFTDAGSRDLTNGQNHLSAMPSLHVGWSALCAHAAWSALRGKCPRLALLAWLSPPS